MSFRFRPALAGFTALGVAALVSLGSWQIQRLEWKRDLMDRVEARIVEPPIPLEGALAAMATGDDVEYRAVVARGVYDHGRAARVFAAQDGVAGYLLFTPLRDATDGRIRVWVNRGFVPQSVAPTELAAPAGPVEVVGLLRTPERRTGAARIFRAKDQPQDNLYFVRDPAAFDGPERAEVSSVYIDSSGVENNGPWPQGGITRVTFSNRHFEYAVTWYGLAAALIGVYLAYSLRR